MYSGLNRDQWLMMSVTLAHTANLNRDPSVRREPFMPSDFDIYDEQGELKRPVITTPPPLSKMLAAAFPNGKKG